MKRIIGALLLTALLACALSALGGCGTPADDGAVINVYLGEKIYDFDPTDFYADSAAERAMSLLFEPLFSVDAAGKLSCAAAKSYKIDKEERRIVVTLRESYWSDATRVKAADFIYAWRDVLLDSSKATPAAALLYDIEGATAAKSGGSTAYYFGAKATDTYEITITYREGADTDRLLRNLSSVATSPLREDIVNNAPGYWSKTLSYAVSNGPFRLATLDYTAGIFTLARNSGYHQSPTAEDKTKNVTPAKLMSSFAVNGEYLSYDDIAAKTVFVMNDATLADRKAHKDAASVADAGSAYVYAFNTDNPIFANESVRLALSLAIDRAAVVNAITFGKAADGLVPGSGIGASLSDMARAKELLAAAEASMSAPLQKSFTLTVNDDEESLAVAGIAKAAWEELGFTVTINAVGVVTTEITDRQTNEELTINDSGIQKLLIDAAHGVRNYDVIGFDWMMYSDDAFVPLTAFASSLTGFGTDIETGNKRKNVTGWSSPDYDALMNAAFVATDRETRDGLLRSAEKLLLDSAPITPVYFNQSFTFSHADISGVTYDAAGNPVYTKMKLKDYGQYLNKE